MKDERLLPWRGWEGERKKEGKRKGKKEIKKDAYVISPSLC